MNRWLLIFLLTLTGLRLFIGSQMEVSPDEAYYYQWSQRLDWAYYSKGPGVALAIRAGTALFGPTEIGVRFLSPLFGLGTSLILFALARRMASGGSTKEGEFTTSESVEESWDSARSVATWTVLMVNLTPIFNVGGLVMTIDALSIFFWATALLTFWLALERSPRFSWYWPLTGALMGLGFLSKYTNVLQLLSIVLVLVLTPKLRSEFRRPGFWTLIGVFLLGAFPPLYWMSQHDWITVQTMAARGGIGSKFSIHPEEFLAYLGAHAGVYSPLIFIGMLVALVSGIRQARLEFKARFLVIFALPLLVLYFSLALKHAGQANWTAPAFVSLGILTAGYWHRLAGERLWARRFVVAALGLGLVSSVLIVNLDVLRQLGIPLEYSMDPGGRTRGWKSVAITVEDYRHRLEKESGKPVFLIGNKYQTAACLAFYLPEKRVDGPGHPPVYIPESQAIENQYSFWPRYDEMINPTELARTLLPGVTDPAKRDALSTAIAGASASKLDPDSAEASERRRTLIRALLAVDPALPIDEYGSAELGVSLFFGRDALYISDEKGDGTPRAISKGFDKVEMVELWRETRRGFPLRTIRLFTCHNYRSLPL